MTGWLEGKVALVTGGGSGIGRAVVEAFLQEGASVCVLERDQVKCDDLATIGRATRARHDGPPAGPESPSAGPESPSAGLEGPSASPEGLSAGDDTGLVAVQGDATSAADNARAVTTALDHFGRLDTLATFVGVFDDYTALMDIPGERLEEAFRETFDVNVKSVLLAVRASAPHLRETHGSVVITGSSSSFYPGRGGALYVASKFALRGLVLQLGHELAPDVRVNGVAPGGTLGTDLRGLHSLGQDGSRLDDQPDRAAAQKARTPLAVALTGADHTGAYVYLASDRARGVSGEIVRSDGGMALN